MVLLSVVVFFGIQPSFTAISPENTFSESKSVEKKVELIATGDVILARTVNTRSHLYQDFTWAFKKTADVLKKADLLLINLETPLLENCPLTDTGMVFCGSLKHLEGLKQIDVDVVNLANNHSGNWGEEGIRQTAEALKNEGMAVCGLGELAVKAVKGTSFGFLGFNDVDYQPLLIADADEKLMAEQVRSAKKQVDVLLISMHWGAEYTHLPTERQKSLAYLLIDNGADLIIGNHPHWIQPIEFYKGKLIVYAHGNFVFDQMWSLKTRQGVAGRYVFYEDKLIEVQFMPVLISDYGQPEWLEGEEKERILLEMKQI